MQLGLLVLSGIQQLITSSEEMYGEWWPYSSVIFEDVNGAIDRIAHSCRQVNHGQPTQKFCPYSQRFNEVTSCSFELDTVSSVYQYL